MLDKIQKWLTSLIIKHYNETELDSVASQITSLRKYVELLDTKSVVNTVKTLNPADTFISQFTDVEHLHKSLVLIRQSLDDNSSITQYFNSSGKTKRFTANFLTIANGVYVKPESYLPNIKTEILAVLTHMEKLQVDPKKGVQFQNEYILRFLISDMIEFVKHLLKISATK